MKTKGFTLIELLAVIAVLIIILLIAVATINSIISSAKRGAFKSNAQLVLEGVEIKTSDVPGFDPLSIDEANITSELSLEDDNYNYINISLYNNENYIFVIGQNKWDGLTACGSRRNMKIVDSDDTSSCAKNPGFIVERTIDTTPGSFGGGNGTTCPLAWTIDSIEDLVYFSNQVNAGTNYSGKCIKLATSLDFNQSKSYVDKNTTAFGDINGNGTTEGLKMELTTSGGFMPVGNNSNYFVGTFAGEENYIYNLFINRPTTDYVGLFGKNGGTITTLGVAGTNITGKDYTAGIAGYSQGGSIIEDSVSGNVTGDNYVGLTAGYINGATLSSITVQGNVTGTDYVGGMVGRAYNYCGDMTLSGVNKGGTIISTGSSVGRIFGGEWSGCGGSIYSSLALKLAITLNGVSTSSSSINSKDGADLTNLSELNNINVAEVALDTYIGGDNDNNGYYWDYDNNGDVVRKNTSSDPLTFSLAGSGITVDPYLITSYDDLRQASLRLSSVYKLSADINMADNKFYILGSYKNNFSGTFDGNSKTISNLTINATPASYVGLMGRNSGTIKNLNLINETVSGNHYTAGIAGYSSGTISGISQQGFNITGKDYTAGIAGYSQGGSIIEDSVSGNVTGDNYVGLTAGYINEATLSSITVQGNVTGTDYVGGMVGRAYNYCGDMTLSGVNKGGTIISTGSSVGRIFGGEWSGCGGSIYSSSAVQASTTLNGLTVTSTNPAHKNGLDITSGDLSDSATYIARGFNFTNEALDYIWYIDGSSAKFREGTG